MKDAEDVAVDLTHDFVGLVVPFLSLRDVVALLLTCTAGSAIIKQEWLWKVLI